MVDGCRRVRAQAFRLLRPLENVPPSLEKVLSYLNERIWVNHNVLRIWVAVIAD